MVVPRPPFKGQNCPSSPCDDNMMEVPDFQVTGIRHFVYAEAWNCDYTIRFQGNDQRK
ncbi:unnamed protein product [Dovyalis caffra]|uniref:CUB domain-containing protein n=1 Tax=Dovyalis caffra TaxID=77055 RepID=A0AAV1S7R2_9ROSI|nr:unnamed protein product [Dovyalis caffra]